MAMSKPVYILGISAFYHDSAAALVKDGRVVCACQEERFSRKKHDYRFPALAVKACLKDADIRISEVDHVVFYDKPFIKFERILETMLSCVPLGFSQFIHAMPLWLKEKLWTRELIRRELKWEGDILFTRHHESHAASAFYPSNFNEAAILTMDGVGEWDTSSICLGKENDIEIIESLRFPHSLGLLYSAFTYYAGFKVNSGEYKLMGLAPYGEPRFASLILEELVDLKEDGSFGLNMEYFAYCYGLKMINRKFEKLFGQKKRNPETNISRHFMDIAASIQKVTEEIVLRMARHARKVTGMENLCLAGGVALNCVANGRILKEGIFKNIWIQPASGDAGGALGAALLIWHRYLNKQRLASEGSNLNASPFLGPEYVDTEIEEFLFEEKVPHKKIERSMLPEIVAGLIEKGSVIGWFQGRMEFGPRALGARSIIGDARDTGMQSRMNLKIKYRESFRPFAPSVLADKASQWFELECQSPYMLLVAPVSKDKRVNYGAGEDRVCGFDKLKIRRSSIPAVTHVDYSARVQTVTREENPL